MTSSTNPVVANPQNNRPTVASRSSDVASSYDEWTGLVSVIGNYASTTPLLVLSNYFYNTCY